MIVKWAYLITFSTCVVIIVIVPPGLHLPLSASATLFWGGGSIFFFNNFA